MDSFELDKLVMLLSADWFLPYWQLIGIFEDDEKKNCLQQGFREIVRQLMSGAKQYWNIDFSSERVRQTRFLFDALIKKCKLGIGNIQRLNRLVSGEEVPIDDGTRWLLVSMTEQLLQNSIAGGPTLDAAIKEVLLKVWNNPVEITFKDRCTSSTSNWDQYLRGTTPDLPAMLADYVSTVASDSKFEVLWGIINTKLTAKQRHELLDWYRATGQALTGEPLRLAHEV